MNVFISPNIKKESVRIDPSGNTIDARTKQILKPVEPEFVVPVATAPVETPYIAPQAPILNVTPQVSPLSIQDQITQAEANLAQLQELKKLKIAEMEAQLELLKL